MRLTMHMLVGVTGLGLMLGSQALAGSQNPKPVKNPNKVNANQGKKTGEWAKDKSACQGLDSQAKQLTAQEKQLFAQAKQLEVEEKSLLAQAKGIEQQRVAEEHSVHRGQNNAAAEAQVKQLEQQRVNLEHQATEKNKEREALFKQADELGKQRREIEAQHKQECSFNKGAKSH